MLSSELNSFCVWVHTRTVAHTHIPPHIHRPTRHVKSNNFFIHSTIEIKEKHLWCPRRMCVCVCVSAFTNGERIAISIRMYAEASIRRAIDASTCSKRQQSGTAHHMRQHCSMASTRQCVLQCSHRRNQLQRIIIFHWKQKNRKNPSERSENDEKLLLCDAHCSSSCTQCVTKSSPSLPPRCRLHAQLMPNPVHPTRVTLGSMLKGRANICRLMSETTYLIINGFIVENIKKCCSYTS